MSLKKLIKKSFLAKKSMVLSAAVLVLTAFVPVADALPLNPIPDPIAAGWSYEGSEPFAEATPLVITDTTAVPPPSVLQPYLNFFVVDDAAFTQDIKLNPSLTVDTGFVPAADGNTGVHVTINDGLREIRAVLLPSASGLKVALVTPLTPSGFTHGIDLGGLGGQFSLTRRVADGAGVLSVGSQTETLVAGELPGSRRPGAMTLEFGTYNVPASSVSRWQTLGLESVTVPEPSTLLLFASGLAGLAVLRKRLKVHGS